MSSNPTTGPLALQVCGACPSITTACAFGATGAGLAGAGLVVALFFLVTWILERRAKTPPAAAATPPATVATSSPPPAPRPSPPPPHVVYQVSDAWDQDEYAAGFAAGEDSVNSGGCTVM